MKITHFTVEPVSLITHDDRQMVKIQLEVDITCRVFLHVYDEEQGELLIREEVPVACGEYHTDLFLPRREKNTKVRWEMQSPEGEVLITYHSIWEKPREWTFYVMVSSHTDIGLHNSQYYQRYMSEKMLDDAAALCDNTDDRPEENRYRYTMEGRWFWENYPADRGAEAAEKILNDYIHKGKIGLCSGIAGNHTHAFGLEEMCRSAYSRSKLLRDWRVDSRTMCMVDNNGLSWGMVAPYADAGYENLIFAPNHWNPLYSTVWYNDRTNGGFKHYPNNGGGGSRVDVRFDSAVPMLFFWRSPDDQKELLVWASNNYSSGGMEFGFLRSSKNDLKTIGVMEGRFAARLPKMEKRWPYDIWLLANYGDDQPPTIELTDLFAAWNAKWKYPQIRTLGDPNVPFDLIRERFGDKIPVLHGEMTGGWYQHPLSASELLSDKLIADRRLANAEVYASLAALYTDYTYPTCDFFRAWEYLLWNDEHSYGTSGYQGRRVYETWMQHRDWIEKATATASTETNRALDALCKKIPAAEDSVVVFNPTARTRNERVTINGQSAVVNDIPSCGYKVVSAATFANNDEPTVEVCTAPPTVENEYYRIRFDDDGSMRSIFDKELNRELLDDGEYGANGFVFTEDNHKTFVTPKKARFTITRRTGVITVTAEMDEPISGAEITQTVTLDSVHRRIDIDNRLSHVRSMVNTNRYYRYLYYAFPFAVENARRICQLNGCEAEYARDLTGHGTDTYMNAHEWALAENGEFGVALFQQDSLLVEFDHIHPDKTDCGAAGNGSAIFSYVANDWLQMHQAGGSHVNFHIRYAITSWGGSSTAAKVREMAECYVNPITAKPLSKQDGVLPANENSFLTVPENQRLICLKYAEDGNGMIARLYGPRKDADVCLGRAQTTFCTIDERPAAAAPEGFGFSTIRIATGEVTRRPDTPDIVDEECPAPIGSVWTGLITAPRAARGENDGHLYLIWGQNMEKNLSHYELYRSEVSGFVPSEENFVCNVEPGVYRVGLYVDEGLKTHTEYFYRIRAVNTESVCGEFSEEFSGITKEPIEE